MNRRDTTAVLLALCAAPFASVAWDDQPVKRPYVERGDCWSYKAKNYNNRGPIEDYETCITFVDAAKNVMLGVITVKSDGREIDTSSTLEWAYVTGGSGQIFSQPARMLHFPLRVGDSYTVEYDVQAPLIVTEHLAKHKWNVKVVGWEEVTVPAGTFHALKIEGEGSYQRLDRGFTAKESFSRWYVPEVNRWVRSEYSDSKLRGGEPEIHELTGFHLHE
jgi:hypothetical protein